LRSSPGSSAPDGGSSRKPRHWTYAVYFGLDGSGLEYELYDLGNNLEQMTNLLHGAPTRDIEQEWARLHGVLTARLVVFANLPNNFGWLLEPATA
jgi:hypothetical protein